MKNNKFLILILCVICFLQVSCGISQTPIPSEKSFEVKGFHLDLRIQVMKPEALKTLVDELSAFGINTLIMEWEATFPFDSHPLIPNRYAYTKLEVADFIAYCKTKQIEVIPLQQSLGHLEYVLRHSRYDLLRENNKDVSQICPMESELNKKLLTDLFTEMAALHPSKYFHIGGDEAYLFGSCGKCSTRVEEAGKSTLLAEHLKMVTDILVSLGKTPILWSDIANKYPDKLDLLPKETIFLVWNYGWALDRFGDPKKLIEKGFEVWGAASLRSNPDNFYLTNWEKHFNNIKDFIPVCRNSDYNGMIMTSWSTSGVYSPVFEDKQTITDLIPIRNVYPISGFRILLAAYAKAVQDNNDLDIEKFMISYCIERFEFTKDEALQFWVALKGMPYQVIDAKVEKHKELTVEILHDAVVQNQNVLNALQPKKNRAEFEHYRLMTDIRENYMAFKNIEVFVNSPEFNVDNLNKVLGRLQVVIEKDKILKSRFTDLNTALLYPMQIAEENRVRIQRVQQLYNRLSKFK